jgi:hypothetical protein
MHIAAPVMFPLLLVLKFLLKQMTRDICWHWDESAELEGTNQDAVSKANRSNDVRDRKANREVLGELW